MPKEPGEGSREDEAEEMRERVDKLRQGDHKYADSVRVLAEAEDEFRNEIQKDADETNVTLNSKFTNRIANKVSTKDLEAMEARQAGWTDVLTKLKNKNAYQQELPELISKEKKFAGERREKKEEHNCAMLVIDFDHFKKVNDEYNHDVGDQALKAIAEIIKDAVRLSDMVYRFGGEEFIVFLPSTDSAGAQAVAEKIRKKIEETPIKAVNRENNQDVVLHKTVSIGCVGTDQMGKEWDEYSSEDSEGFLKDMFGMADVSAMASKKAGRNCVTSFNPELLADKK